MPARPQALSEIVRRAADPFLAKECRNLRAISKQISQRQNHDCPV
jgi:hypothetical protein